MKIYEPFETNKRMTKRDSPVTFVKFPFIWYNLRINVIFYKFPQIDGNFYPY